MARRACRGAAFLTAVSDTYLAWGLKHARRQSTDKDAVFPLGYEPPKLDEQELEGQCAVLARRGVDLTRPVCFFAGGLERHHDLVTVINAAFMLQKRGLGDVQFVICGDGSYMPMLRDRARKLPNVHLLGWVDAPTLQAVALRSVIGLCAYSRGALMSIGNKPYEYMAGGLAIVSSLPGELADLLEKYECGLSYRAGDAGSLAECLAKLLSAPRDLRRMRENARRAWSTHYCSRDVYTRFVDHLARMTTPVARAA
jgi:glycosyltransferase involved in cell wall biosynthesis